MNKEINKYVDEIIAAFKQNESKFRGSKEEFDKTINEMEKLKTMSIGEVFKVLSAKMSEFAEIIDKKQK